MLVGDTLDILTVLSILLRLRCTHVIGTCILLVVIDFTHHQIMIYPENNIFLVENNFLAP